MAHAHICLDCGMDLARTRASYDTEYGLLVVQCPCCNRAAVRMRHPVTAWWRRFPNTVFTVLILAFQMLVVLVLTLATFGGSRFFGYEINGHWNRETMIIFILLTLVLPIVVGAWLTSGLSHWKRRYAWLGWGVWLLSWYLLLSMLVMMDGYSYTRGYVLESDITFRDFFLDWIDSGEGKFLIQGLIYIPIQLIAALPGIPLGMGINWLLKKGRSALWCKHYRAKRLVVAR